MMRPSTEIETKGLAAYEQARAFENLQRRHLPLLYGGFTLLLLLCGAGMLKMNLPVESTICFLAGIAFPMMTWLHWRRMQLRHVENLLLLRELERQYGEQLPWIQVERHLAALEKLQEELRAEGAIDPPAIP